MSSVPQSKADEAPDCIGCGQPVRRALGQGFCECFRVKPDGQLYHENVINLRLLQEYYEVLNQDTDFAAALRDLDDQIGQYFRDAGPVAEAPPLAREIATAFVDRWRLPRRRGLEDLLWSLGWPSDELKLHAVSARWSSRVVYGVIRPYTPEPFRYDPTLAGLGTVKNYARALADEVYTSIMQQAEALTTALKKDGFREIPPVYKNMPDEQLRALALRLYRYAVKEFRWSEIARLERAEEGDIYLDSDTHKHTITVKDWARKLDIPLPPSKPSGRPKKSTSLPDAS